MKKSTISIIILSIILTIATISGIWTFVLKKPVTDLKEDLLAHKTPKHLAPTQENILMWILENQKDSLESAVQLLRDDNPELSKKLKKYLKTQKKTQNRLFAQVDKEKENKDGSSEKEEPVSEIIIREVKKEIKSIEPEEIAEEIKTIESSVKKQIKPKYLSFKVGNNTVYYTGEMVDGKAHGQGKGVFDNGIVYEGLWNNNQREGKGLQKWPDGGYYEGFFSDNKRSGKGTFVGRSNEKYVGEWFNDMRQGEGTLYDKKGKIKYKGEWKSDLFIQ